MYVPSCLTLKLGISRTHCICVFYISLTINNHYILRQLPQTGLYNTSTVSPVRYDLNLYVECTFLFVFKVLIVNFRQISLQSAGLPIILLCSLRGGSHQWTRYVGKLQYKHTLKSYKNKKIFYYQQPNSSTWTTKQTTFSDNLCMPPPGLYL